MGICAMPWGSASSPFLALLSGYIQHRVCFIRTVGTMGFMPFSMGPADREESPGWALQEVSPMSISSIPTGTGSSPGFQPLWHMGGIVLGSWGHWGAVQGPH